LNTRPNAACKTFYERLKVETILYGVLVVERHETERAPLTRRCQKSRTVGSEIVEWFRQWQRAAAQPNFQALLMDASPRLAGGMALTVTHVEQNGLLAPVEFRMRVKHPLVSDARVEPWVAALVGACDGSRSGIEVFGYLKEQEVISEEMSKDEFGGVLRLLPGKRLLGNRRIPASGRNEEGLREFGSRRALRQWAFAPPIGR
jgi:hypothetical protein